MSTHTMTRDAHSIRINLRKRLKNRLGQFLRDISVHVIASVVGSLCSIDVEPSSGAKVVCVVFAFDIQASYLSIHIH